ncbi:MAG: RNA-guided endonuclease InsQ/TnpB family protein [Nitrososphaera sp.]
MPSNLRNYKYRLYPTALQEGRLSETLNASRWLYNYFLNQNIESKEDMQFALTELKEQEGWLRNYHSKMLQMVVHKIDASRKALYALRSNGHKIGKLHFVKRDDYNSFTYNQSGFKVERHDNTDLLWLSKIGYVEIRLSRKPFNIKQVTVKRSCCKWYVVVACEFAKPIFKLVSPEKSVGIDIGITKFAHDSDNNSVDNPLFLKEMLKPLCRASRRLSRRQKGSKNREKARTRLQILHERIRNKRNDFLHKVSTEYSKRYDMIFLERLQMSNMVKNHHLARSILDSGWGTFKNMLQYKAKMVVEVSPHHTSVDCSRCGNKVPKTLAVCTHRCDRCGLVTGRDHNASLNIKRRGLMMLPKEFREVTAVEIQHGSVKQQESSGLVQR